MLRPLPNRKTVTQLGTFGFKMGECRYGVGVNSNAIQRKKKKKKKNRNGKGTGGEKKRKRPGLPRTGKPVTRLDNLALKRGKERKGMG